MMTDEKVLETMHANLRFAEELANKIFIDTGNDGKDAFVKVVGTLAHIVYVSVEKDRREDVVAKLPNMLTDFLTMLDTMDDFGAAIERPH
jgi:hypothetical protein